MAKVTGIGGIFFKAKDPEAVTNWYQKHLGISVDEQTGVSFQWRDKENPERIGRTVWSPFPENTTYFDPSKSSFMLNFRVDNLDEILASLKAQGVQVIDKVEEYEYGRFDWILDPEGNKVELWEPAGEAGQKS
jgi:predicted enzyme related to lactoylglutathione lyase